MRFKDLLKPEVTGTLHALLVEFYGESANNAEELSAILDQPVTETNLSILKSAADIFNRHLDDHDLN